MLWKPAAMLQSHVSLHMAGYNKLQIYTSSGCFHKLLNGKVSSFWCFNNSKIWHAQVVCYITPIRQVHCFISLSYLLFFKTEDLLCFWNLCSTQKVKNKRQNKHHIWLFSFPRQVNKLCLCNPTTFLFHLLYTTLLLPIKVSNDLFNKHFQSSFITQTLKDFDSQG